MRKLSHQVLLVLCSLTMFSAAILTADLSQTDANAHDTKSDTTVGGGSGSTQSEDAAACNEEGLRTCISDSWEAIASKDRRLKNRVRGILEPACDEGSAEACSNLGDLYLYGSRERPLSELVLARSLYERACSDGFTPACPRLADMLMRGWDGSNDVGRALALLEETCGSGHAFSCYHRAMLFSETKSLQLDDISLTLDYRRARELFEHSCHLGMAEGCMVIATWLAAGTGVKQDKGHAAHFFKKACYLGHEKACHFWRRSLLFGKHLSDEHRGEIEMALEAHGQACARALPESCFILGWAIASGLERRASGNEEAWSLADSLVERACEGGQAAACFFQGFIMREKRMWDESRSMPDFSVDDRHTSRELAQFQRACDGGYLFGCFTALQPDAWTSYSESGGYGLRGDRPDYTPHTREALADICKSGFVVACDLVGKMLAAGDASAQDLAAARRHFELTCRPAAIAMVECVSKQLQTYLSDADTQLMLKPAFGTHDWLGA